MRKKNTVEKRENKSLKMLGNVLEEERLKDWQVYIPKKTEKKLTSTVHVYERIVYGCQLFCL